MEHIFLRIPLLAFNIWQSGSTDSALMKNYDLPASTERILTALEHWKTISRPVKR